MSGRIVVGVDGSECSIGALRWALDEAERRGDSVDAVHAWHFPYLASAGPYAMPVAAEGDLQGDAKQVLDLSIERAGGGRSTVQIDPILVEGSAAARLIEVARQADLLVVGSRGRGGFTGLLLGSVSQQCAHHTPCPLVIVPASGDD